MFINFVYALTIIVMLPLLGTYIRGSVLDIIPGMALGAIVWYCKYYYREMSIIEKALLFFWAALTLGGIFNYLHPANNTGYGLGTADEFNSMNLITTTLIFSTAAATCRIIKNASWFDWRLRKH